MLESLNQQLVDRYANDPTSTVQDIKMMIYTLEKNREASIQAEYNNDNSCKTEEEAAILFAQGASSATASDGNERGAVIITMEIPVVNEKGQIVMEERKILGEMFTGETNNVIEELITTYIGCLPLIENGAQISFIHTHPKENQFSGEKGATPQDIINEVMRIMKDGDNFNYFSHFLGDAQVPWLKGVDKMYLVSPVSNEIYACDANGPITDSSTSSGYSIMAKY